MFKVCFVADNQQNKIGETGNVLCEILCSEEFTVEILKFQQLS